MEGLIKNISIKYRWWQDNNISIPEKHEEALEEDAINKIFEMIKEGFSSGELNTIVRFGKDVVKEEDENEGLSYSGWFEITKDDQPSY